MTTLNSRLLASMAFAMMLPLAAPVAQAHPELPPFRGEFGYPPDAARRHAAEMWRMNTITLERDIDLARSDIQGLHFRDARRNAEAALAMANILESGRSKETDPARQAVIADAEQHIDVATKLLYKDEPWEARRELATARIDVTHYADQLAL